VWRITLHIYIQELPTASKYIIMSIKHTQSYEKCIHHAEIIVLFCLIYLNEVERQEPQARKQQEIAN